MSTGRQDSSHRFVSMADVAERAGVSQQTVSRVVNGQPNVSEPTRKAVQKAMDELGFRPSFAGRSLRSGRYRSVGLCIYNITQFGNLSTLDGIMTAAREHGDAITMVEMGDDDPVSLEHMTKRMLTLPVDAMIMSMSIKAEDFDTFRPSPGFGTFVAGPSYSVDSNFRERGWRDALEVRGLNVVEPLRGDWTADSGYEAGATLAADKDMTAVYVANDQMALGVIAALEDAGRRVPEDVSVVGVDDSLTASVPHNRLTTVRFDLFSRGRRAFEQALLGTSPNYRVQQIRIAGTLVERQTVRDLN